jgi:hypothetical protein
MNPSKAGSDIGGDCQISLDCETFEGLETFAYRIKVRPGRKRKTALPGEKAVNSPINVVKKS